MLKAPTLDQLGKQLPDCSDGDPVRALHKIFGFQEFRPGQLQAVEAVLDDRDALVVMPTGAGKSLCYQLPGLMRDDLTLVVSPLVSLMQDQVESLEAIAPGRVALINSQQTAAQNRIALERASAGEVRILYIAPERFGSPGFLETIKEIGIGLFVVDEAHCVSEWGHDFRPDYFRLGDAARWLGAKSLIAVTATATPTVANDIAQRLGLNDPVRVHTGFDRPNLTFAVIRCADKDQAAGAIATALSEPGSLPAIVYSGTRARTTRLAQQLQQALEVPVVSYHAGLNPEARADTQRRFMSGEVPVVVATNAFGMGVDKADVRTVCHDGVPGSIEAYYQEAGRAGRDGQPGRCLLFACNRDKGLHVFFIERSLVDEAVLARVARYLLTHSEDGRYNVGVGELLAEVKCDEELVRPIVGHLVHGGLIKPNPSSADRLTGRVLAAWDGQTRSLANRAARAGGQVRWRQYRSVWGWVEGSRCRRVGLLRHFGDGSRPQPTVECCDCCVPALIKPYSVFGKKTRVEVAPRSANGSSSGAKTKSKSKVVPVVELSDFEKGSLETAILAMIATAKHPMGRSRAVEILKGSRSKDLLKYSYDGMPQYGTFAHLHRSVLLAVVDGLLDTGKLRSTGGQFPKVALVEKG